MADKGKAAKGAPRASHKGDKHSLEQSSVPKSHNTKLLEKVEITIKTYPDLQPFLEMAVLLL